MPTRGPLGAGAADGDGRARPGLRARLIRLQLVVFGTLLAAGPLTYLFLSRSLARELDAETLAAARAVAATLTGPRPPLPEAAAAAGLGLAVACPLDRSRPYAPAALHWPRHVLVVDERERTVCSDGDPAPIVPLAVARARATGRPVFTDQRRGAEELRVVALPFTDAAGRSHVAEIGSSRAAIARTLRRGLRILAAVDVVALLLLAAGSRQIAERAMRHLRRLVDRLSSIDEDRLGDRVPVRGADELEPLVRVINRMLDRLEAAFAAQRRFVGDVSHEIRSPLTAMRGQIEVALRKERSAAEYRQVLEDSLEEVVRLARLAEHLLALARADAGVLDVQRVAIDVREVVSRALRHLGQAAEARDIRLTLEARAAPAVLGDPDWLQRVFENLLDNAIRHTPRTGAIEVRVAVERDRAMIAVADAGEGIPAEDLPRVFDRFYRVDRARARETGGAGLGLAISRQIVRLHGGELRAESALGAGSTFTVELPLAAAARGHAAADPA